VPLILRVVRAGLVTAIAVAATGWIVERVRYGGSDEAAVARLEGELNQRFASAADTLQRIAAGLATATDAIDAAPRNQAQARRLFDLLAETVQDESRARTGVTLFDASGAPLAWAGRVWDIPKERIQGPRAEFVAPGALGPRLIHVEPITAGSGPAAPRRATVVVEESLGSGQPSPVRGDAFAIETSIAPVIVRPAVVGVDSGRPLTFAVRGPNGATLVTAEVAADDLADARARWRRLVVAALLVVAATTLLLCSAPLIERRRSARDITSFTTPTAGLVALIVVARFILYFAFAPFGGNGGPAPLDLLLTALTLAALVWIGIDLIERRRVTRPRPALASPSQSAATFAVAAFAAAGAADVVLLWSYERLLRGVVADSPFDLVRFSLHPATLPRLGSLFALVLLHATAIWSSAAIIRAPSLVRRIPRLFAVRVAPAAWFGGAAVAILAARFIAAVPIGPLLVALLMAGACAVSLVLRRSRARHASQAARMFALLLALAAPAVAMYPSLYAFATEAKDRLVASDYGPQALGQRERLKEQLQETVDEIDALPTLREFVVGARAVADAPDRAFVVWSRTPLAIYRLKSSIELYDAEGRLVSRFALNLPEYESAAYRPSSCSWDSLEESSPFGSAERHVLRASRRICTAGGRPVGAITVRAMLDPEDLPFISSQSPYLEALRPTPRAQEAVSGRDVEFTMYGWSRSPLYALGTDVWALPDNVFARAVASREPFWTELDRDDDTYRVYLLNDRGGIYALGYPTVTPVGHLIALAELVLLAFVLYAMLAAISAAFSAALLGPPTRGRALLREIRSSFYYKLFLFFVGGAVVPVVILAIVTRNYFRAQVLAGAEEAAARTVTTAQRLVEDYATLQQRGTAGLAAIDDQIMILVRRAVNEDVNLFDRTRLQATSARDLFASQLLSNRTPADIYKTIVLDRLPAMVSHEEVGDFPYLLAAAPVRAAGREEIVTVPLANRQQQIEEQMDELDRRVVSAAVLFSLLGAAVGYWMAERIADPVNRLTRATRRIARGDLDARIAETSSDELRRLVEDFNQMAADLKRQRDELERTQRLEAWAEMARQVAHDIKNPLTPIQLSAEHARRVNIDRGRPLSPVLDDCVNAILSQVKLLRQISAEFSSFASSPTARPEPTALPSLIDEVVEPYRAPLAGRIAIAVQSAPDLPVVSIDRGLFARALTNVIENALHAMPGTGTLSITSRQSPDGAAAADSSEPPAPEPATPRSVVVEIADTGVGMDDDALKRIFEPYFSTKATGTGLGLTIAKRNVELNGGRVQVNSRRGVGTTVTITLPA
jgi:signal transduction histidine kinase